MESQAFLLQEDDPVCPFKRIRRVDLEPKSNQLLIDHRLSLIFNVTSSKMLNLEGCSQIKLYSTSLEGIFISLDNAAKKLYPIKSRNIHESESLLPSIEYFKFTNCQFIQSLLRKQNDGDCYIWMLIGNDRDYLHPTLKRKGLFTRRVGALIHEYHCKLLSAPIVELDMCITGVPVVIRGEL